MNTACFKRNPRGAAASRELHEAEVCHCLGIPGERLTAVAEKIIAFARVQPGNRFGPPSEQGC